MIVGTGTDIVDVRRIARVLERFGDRFTRRILSDAEMREGLAPVRAASYLARQFAAKEAVSKALGSGMRQGVCFRNIQVLRLETGAPLVRLASGALARAHRISVTRVHLSIADEGDYALAYAIAVGGWPSTGAFGQ